MTRICEKCNGPIATGNSRFCSRRCWHEASKGKRPAAAFEKPCATCGTKFLPSGNRQKYCSETCKKVTCLCKTCGKTFLQTKHTTGNFCSSKCWYDAPGKRLKVDAICESCGKTYSQRSTDQKTCSHKCGVALITKHPRDRVCAKCRKPFHSRYPDQKHCSRSCGLEGREGRGANRAIGDLQPTDEGYLKIKTGKNYPGAHKSGWMLHHRYVYQEHRRRTQPDFVLQDDEIVHHKNGMRQQNDFDNLELTIKGHKGTFKHVPGQRVEDLIRYLIRRHPEISRQLMDEL